VTEIKICGITNSRDAAVVAGCGADAVGFIFHPQSPRYVAPEVVKDIIEELPEDITTIGVFVNRSVKEIKEIVAFCRLDMVQLHGAESPAFCSKFPRARIIKALALGKADDVASLRDYPVKAILIDADDPVRHGGTGEKANWEMAVKVKATHPLILAGGLSLVNIEEAITAVSPDAVDINSGVETTPGRKNHGKVRKIIELVHSLGENRTTIFNRHSAPSPAGGRKKVPLCLDKK
jgi:phosphoribosylanthranilate isomerase